MTQRFLLSALVLAGMLSVAAPAAAIRLSCEELAAQRAAGRTDEEIIQTFGTTKARLAACDRLADQSERFEKERQQFHQERADAGLPH